MLFDEEREAELQALVQRLERMVPREGAHLTMPADAEGTATIGNRLGYLRFAVEFLEAALHPLPESETDPPRIVPDLGDLLTGGSKAPFELCELDESIVSRPPARTRLGTVGQLGAGVLVVAVLILLFIGASVVWHWVFG